jgi:5-formyltetrahydrofolate cyclo-ligase
MKRASVIMGIIGFIAILGVVGCGEKVKSPQDVAKGYIDEKFKSTGCDLANLDYEVSEEKDGSVKVNIKGEINYDETITLAKQDNKWVVAPVAAAAPVADEAPQAAKETSHAPVKAAAAVHEAPKTTAHEAPKAAPAKEAAPAAAHH